jgi:hypothetical protein
MDSATAYLGLTKLRFWKKIYGPVFPALRDPIVRTTTETAAREKSLQGFEVDMTREEARNVLGMTQAYVFVVWFGLVFFFFWFFFLVEFF